MWSGWALVALAFADDFEAGNFARWSNTRINRSDVMIDAGFSGAHRGQFGLTIFDNESYDGGQPFSGPHNYVELGVAPAEPELYVRYWLRVRESNAGGYVVIAWMLGTFAGFISTEAGFDATDLYIHGNNRDGGSVSVPQQQRFDAGTWHLVEIATTGGGTANGHRLFWVDGAPIADSPGDFTGQPTLGVTLGQTFAETPWKGIIDFDDFRTSTTPMASRLEVAQGGAVDATCVPLKVELWASSRERKPAPYGFVAALVVDGGTVHSGVTCSGPATVFFDAGVGFAQASWAPPASSSATITAEYVDFISVPASLQIGDAGALPSDGGVSGMDGGTGGERNQQVGCGCGSSAGSCCLAVLLIRRRKWRTNRR